MKLFRARYLLPMAAPPLEDGALLVEAGRIVAVAPFAAIAARALAPKRSEVLSLDHLHAPAAEMEHFLGPELQHRLADELATPATDPHGRLIPDQDGTGATR